mgnify:CR=1 FL=1
MGNKINDPIVRLMGLRYKSHPWHGLDIGTDAPNVVTAFIEMVPTDTVKYELDKVSVYKNRSSAEVFERGSRFIWFFTADLLRRFSCRVLYVADRENGYSRGRRPA